MASGLTLKKWFFDRDVVMQAMDRASRSAMSRQGNNIKRIAQTSQRYGKKASTPGTPPNAHKDKPRGPLLRKFLFSAYDARRRSQFIGSQKLGGSNVPSVTEHGGTTLVTALVPRVKGRALSPAAKAAFLRKAVAGQINNAAQQRQHRIVKYPARPYMRPAMRVSMSKYPRLYAGSLKVA